NFRRVETYPQFPQRLSPLRELLKDSSCKNLHPDRTEFLRDMFSAHVVGLAWCATCPSSSTGVPRAFQRQPRCLERSSLICRQIAPTAHNAAHSQRGADRNDGCRL